MDRNLDLIFQIKFRKLTGSFLQYKSAPGPVSLPAAVELLSLGDGTKICGLASAIHLSNASLIL